MFPHDFEVQRCHLDVREDDLKTLHLLQQEAEFFIPPSLQPLVKAYTEHLAGRARDFLRLFY
jgi:hypothetical protein